jgi:hypothetical protein
MIAVERQHYWSAAKLAKLTADQRRELRGKLARQERSQDPEHRAQAAKVLTMLREAETATVPKRVADTRRFLFGSEDRDAARRLDDARQFLHPRGRS